ncbi:MAG: hypothetical protein WDM80_15840 [Limisphaerales bacterium]
MNSIANLSVQQLRQAAALKEKIQSLEKELGRLLGATATPSTSPVAGRKKFKMSAAAKAKISAAAKARWARIKGATPAAKPAVVAAPRKARGKMSAAAKAKLSAKLKAIWAKRRAAKK